MKRLIGIVLLLTFIPGLVRAQAVVEDADSSSNEATSTSVSELPLEVQKACRTLRPGESVTVQYWSDPAQYRHASQALYGRDHSRELRQNWPQRNRAEWQAVAVADAFGVYTIKLPFYRHTMQPGEVVVFAEAQQAPMGGFIHPPHWHQGYTGNYEPCVTTPSKILGKKFVIRLSEDGKWFDITGSAAFRGVVDYICNNPYTPPLYTERTIRVPCIEREVPGPTHYVDRPGPTKYVDRPGPTQYVDRPGPTRYVCASGLTPEGYTRTGSPVREDITIGSLSAYKQQQINVQQSQTQGQGQSQGQTQGQGQSQGTGSTTVNCPPTTVGLPTSPGSPGSPGLPPNGTPPNNPKQPVLGPGGVTNVPRPTLPPTIGGNGPVNANSRATARRGGRHIVFLGG